MYKKDSDFIKMAIIPYFLGTLALYGIKFKEASFFKLCKSFYEDLCKTYVKEIRKMNARLDGLNTKIMNELVNKQNRELNTHKAIICLNAVIQMAIDNNNFDKDYAEKLVSFLEPFQEIESRMPMTDEEWLALKESADKKAKKIYELIFN